MKIKKSFLPIIILVMAFSSCKKTHPYYSPYLVSFEYNGITYSNMGNTNLADVIPFNDLGIFINMPDIFGGYISFPRNGCAYLDPNYFSVYEDAGCKLYTIDTIGNHGVIDSEKVYIYKSGNLNLETTDCETIYGTNISTGQPLNRTTCRVTGTFDLELQNKFQQVIKITNGKVDTMIFL
jgi:hypothetical protein